MPTLLNTDNIAVKERPAYWNFVVSSVLGRLNTTPQRSDPFRGQIAFTHLATIPIAQVGSSQLQVKRPEKFIHDPVEDFYKVNFQLRGSATLIQNRLEAQLEPGDWVIYDNTRPYTLDFHNDYQQLLFLVPRKLLQNRLPLVDLHLSQTFSGARGMGKLLFDFVKNGLAEGDEISLNTQSHMSNMLLDMLLLGLSESRSERETERLPISTRKIQVEQFINIHLSDPHLNPEMIAQGLHLSKRAIHALFADTDQTVMQMVWGKRIERCKRDLLDPRLSHFPIQNIAFSWGFSTSAHFSRLFKAATGRSPRDFRRQAKSLH